MKIMNTRYRLQYYFTGREIELKTVHPEGQHFFTSWDSVFERVVDIERKRNIPLVEDPSEELKTITIRDGLWIIYRATESPDSGMCFYIVEQDSDPRLSY